MTLIARIPVEFGADGLPIAPVSITAVQVDKDGPDWDSFIRLDPALVPYNSSAQIKLDPPPINRGWRIAVTQVNTSEKTVTFAGEQVMYSDLPDVDETTLQPIPDAPTIAEWRAFLSQLALAKGDKGDPGRNAVDGRSAFEIAVSLGFPGTQTEWLASLKGDKGDKGDPGASVKGDKGDPGTSIKGDKGDPGTNGTNGTNGNDGARGYSAYETAVQQGFTGDAIAWIASLKGSKGDKGDAGASVKGDKGDPGTNGTNGTNGYSAYQVAVQQGFVGDAIAWLASLKGAKGDKGDPGTNGTNGAPGSIARPMARFYRKRAGNGNNGDIYFGGGSNTNANIPLDSTAFNDDATFYQLINGTVKVLKAGLYLISYSLRYGADNAAGERTAYLSLNGFYTPIDMISGYVNNTSFQLSNGFVYRLAANDVLYLMGVSSVGTVVKNNAENGDMTMSVAQIGT